MIRPITCVTFLLACGSGLYLYQAKHRVNVLDQQIEQIVHQTEATREQIRLLHAEWTLLNQPDRLQQLANEFLTLRPTNPNQFTSFVELDSRLPPISTEPIPASAQPAAAPVAAVPPAHAVAAATPSPAAPLPPPSPSDNANIPPSSDSIDHVRAPEPRPRIRPSTAVAVAVALPRPLPLHPRPPPDTRRLWSARATASVAPYRPAAAPPAPRGSSLLGMAHGASALPAPLPINAPAAMGNGD